MKARRRFGQNFLERAWVEKVIRAIDPKPDETFIEIGPGHGALTRPLAARAKAVVAYELDRDLAAELRASAPENVRVIEGDVLDSLTGQPPAPSPRPLRVAGNLPYNVASPIMFRLVDLSRAGVPLDDATLMLQREVADRLIAAPGSKEYGVLSVLIQHRASVTRLLNLPPGAFRPSPKVRSALVRLSFHPPAPRVRNEAALQMLVGAVFTQRRKTLANALRACKGSDPIQMLTNADIDGRRRPETLSIAEFVRLADEFAAANS